MDWELLDIDDSNFECELITISVCPSDVTCDETSCYSAAKLSPVIENQKEEKISSEPRSCLINLSDERETESPVVSDEETVFTLSHKTGNEYDSVRTIITRYPQDHTKSPGDVPSTATPCSPTAKIDPVFKNRKEIISLVQKKSIIDLFKELQMEKPAISKKEAASILSLKTGIGYNLVRTIITRYLLDRIAESTSGVSSTGTPSNAVDPINKNKKGRRLSLAQKNCVVNLFKELKKENPYITKKEAASCLSQKTGIGYNSVWAIILRYLVGDVIDESSSGVSSAATSCTLDLDLPPVPKNPSGKIITLEQRLCIVNLFQQLKINKPDISKRKAALTLSQESGIGYKSVWAIITRYLSDNVVQSPNRKRIRKNLVDKVDSATKEAIRNKIQPYFASTESPTLNKLLEDVNADNSLPNFKRTSFYRFLKALGLQFQKSGKQYMLLQPCPAPSLSPITKKPKVNIIPLERRNCIINSFKELQKKNPMISKREAASTLSEETGIGYDLVWTIITRYLLGHVESSGGVSSTATLCIPAVVLPPASKNPSGKIISLERRIRIISSFKQLKMKNPDISKREAAITLSQETGIGYKSVWAIITRYLLDNVIQSPNRKRVRKTLVGKVDSLTKEAIMNKIQPYLSNEEVPSLNKLLEDINSDDSLPNFKRTTFYKLLKALGLHFQKNGRQCMLVQTKPS